jgi:L-lactate dehydrogenase
MLAHGGEPVERIQQEIADSVRYANITIIEGTGASQYGIGAVCARLVEAVLRDEGAVLPVAAYHPGYDVTLSLVSVVGAGGVRRTYEPAMSVRERAGLDRSAATLREAGHRIMDLPCLPAPAAILDSCLAGEHPDHGPRTPGGPASAGAPASASA